MHSLIQPLKQPSEECVISILLSKHLYSSLKKEKKWREEVSQYFYLVQQLHVSTHQKPTYTWVDYGDHI